MKASRSQWIEIRGPALHNNAALFRRLTTPAAQMAAVVKSNAYGHGLSQVVEARRHRVDWFTVHTAMEAAQVRDLAPGRRLVVVGFLAPEEAEFLDDPTHVLVSCREILETVADVGQRCAFRIPIHLKVDTGTNRQGVGPEAIDAFLQRVQDLPIQVVGVALHRASIEDTLEHVLAEEPLRRYRQAETKLATIPGARVRWRNIACSAATLLIREADSTLARLGISVYGNRPSREARLS